MKFDHVLIIGFGGPTKLAEVRPFIQEVTRGLNVPAERLEEVYHHYEVIGGGSPYNQHAQRIKQRLEENLRAGGLKLPVFIGMKNWHPFLKETMREINRKGLGKGIGLILAPQRSDASFDKYLRGVEEAKQEASAEMIEYDYLRPWHDHSFFIEAQADEARKVLAKLNPKELESAYLVFSAHSIPVSMAQKSRYAEEVVESSRLVAKRLNCSKWEVTYQSRSGSPRDHWLEPDALSSIRQIVNKGAKTLVFIPIGFVCENVEILYDLDVEVDREAPKLGFRYLRAGTVMDHPKFVTMLSDLIQEKFTAEMLPQGKI